MELRLEPELKLERYRVVLCCVALLFCCGVLPCAVLSYVALCCVVFRCDVLTCVALRSVMLCRCLL